MSLLESSENHLIVAKDLAYQTNFNRKQLIYITNNFHILFLIRDPHKTIPSNLFPYSESGTLDSFQIEAIGYQDLGLLFNRFIKETQTKPWVIEAEEYLKNPGKILPKYFHRFGLEWHDSYLNLKPKTAEEKKNDPAFLVWENWYEKAYNSSGVRKPKKLNAKVPLYKELIEKEKNLIENLLNISLPHYLSIKRQGRLVHL